MGKIGNSIGCMVWLANSPLKFWELGLVLVNMDILYPEIPLPHSRPGWKIDPHPSHILKWAI
jgi:hypothetical protein